MNVVSFSGGKDSTAMLLLMKENNIPIDDIIFCDTGKEFDELLVHIDKVEKYIGQKITRLKDKHSYEYYLYQKPHPINGIHAGEVGYGWTRMNNRWCTRYLKTRVINKYLRKTYKGETIDSYIGIALDEPERIKDKPNVHYPLVDYKMTEKDALQYCYDRGFDFGGLYKHFNRLGCYLCPLQGLHDLYNLYRYYPNKWKELLKIEDDFYKNIKWNKEVKQFNGRGTVHKIDERFRKQYVIDDWLESSDYLYDIW